MYLVVENTSIFIQVYLLQSQILFVYIIIIVDKLYVHNYICTLRDLNLQHQFILIP